MSSVADDLDDVAFLEAQFCNSRSGNERSRGRFQPGHVGDLHATGSKCAQGVRSAMPAPYIPLSYAYVTGRGIEFNGFCARYSKFDRPAILRTMGRGVNRVDAARPY